MGLSSSTNYDQISRFISQSNLPAIKLMIKNQEISKQELEKYCSEPYQSDDHSRSLLHHAAWTENAETLKLLIENCDKVDLEALDKHGMTALSASINRNNTEAAKYLISKNASLNCDKHNGYFLLRTSISQNNLELTGILLDLGCDTKDFEIDMENGSLLHIATDVGNLNMVKLIVEKARIAINIEDKFKIQCVHVAAWKNYLDILKFLHDKGADYNCEDSMGNVALGWAVFHDSFDVIKYLKELKFVEKPFKNLSDPKFAKNKKKNLADRTMNYLKSDLSNIDLNSKTTTNNVIEMGDIENKIRQGEADNKIGIINLSFK